MWVRLLPPVGMTLALATVVVMVLLALSQLSCATTRRVCDIDGDGAPSTTLDYHKFEAALGSRKGEVKYIKRADFDRDGVVSTVDFGAFMKRCPLEGGE